MQFARTRLARVLRPFRAVWSKPLGLLSASIGRKQFQAMLGGGTRVMACILTSPHWFSSAQGKKRRFDVPLSTCEPDLRCNLPLAQLVAK